MFWLLEQCFLEAAVLFISDIGRPMQGENELGLVPLYLCFVSNRTKRGFSPEEILCGGISVGLMFASVCSCREAMNDAMEGRTSEEHEHVNISTKELVWNFGINICAIG